MTARLNTTTIPPVRLSQILYPDETSVSYTYDAAGNRTAMTDSTGVTTHTSDPVGNRLTENGVIYSYDAATRVTA